MKKIFSLLLFLGFTVLFYQAHGTGEYENGNGIYASQQEKLDFYSQNNLTFYHKLKDSFEQTPAMHDTKDYLTLLFAAGYERDGYCFEEDTVELVSIELIQEYEVPDNFFEDDKKIYKFFIITQTVYTGIPLKPEMFLQEHALVSIDIEESEYGLVLQIDSPQQTEMSSLADITLKRFSTLKWVQAKSGMRYMIEKREIEASAVSYEIIKHDNRNFIQKFFNSKKHLVSTTREEKNQLENTRLQYCIYEM